ncbi:MAG: GAF domain-containing protein, partial [Anaerolineales bacterium]
MDASRPQISESEKGTKFLFALNAAAAQLQRSARSEADIYRVFCDQIVEMGLSGSINLLSGDEKLMTMVVAAVPWDKIASFEGYQDSVGAFHTDFNVRNYQIAIPVESIDYFSRIIKNRQAIFESDNSDYLRQIIPDQFNGILDEVIANFGRRPAIYVPLVIESRIRGLLSVSGDGLSAGDIPPVEAFANHVAIAMENARLFTALQTQVTERQQAEEALRESEQKYRSVVRQSSDGIALVDEHGRVIEWNEGMEQITGLKQSQVLDRAIWDVQFQLSPDRNISDEHRQQVITRIGKLLKTGRSPDVETFQEKDIRRMDGELRTIQIVLNPLKSGKSFMLCSIIRDVTERIGMEKALRMRAEELAALQALSLDLITIHELPVLLSKIVDKAVELLGAKGGSLYLIESEDEQVRLYVTQQDSHQYSVGTTMKFGEGAAGLVANTGKPLIIDDYRSWPGRLKVYDNVQPFSAVLTVPMIWQGEVTGVLQVLDDMEVRRFNQVDQELLTLFANHASVALETTRLLAAERQRRKEAEILGKGSAALTSTLDVDQLLSVILSHLEQVVPYKSASVFLLDGDDLHIVAGRGFDEDNTVVGSRHPVEKDSLFVEIQHRKQSIILEDVQEDSRFQAWGGVRHVRGWLGTPLVVRGEVIGCLTLDSDKVDVYHAGHAALVETFASQAATAIEKARLFEAEIQARQRAEAMGDAAHVLSSSLSLNQVLEVVLDQLSRVVTYDSSSITLLENDTAVVKIWRSNEGSAPENILRTIRFNLSPEHAVGLVVQTGEPLLIRDIKNDKRWLEMPLTERVRSWLGVPLIVRGKVIGLFNIDRNTVGGFTQEDVTLVQTFAAHAAVAIDN